MDNHSLLPLAGHKSQTEFLWSTSAADDRIRRAIYWGTL